MATASECWVEDAQSRLRLSAQGGCLDLMQAVPRAGAQQRHRAFPVESRLRPRAESPHWRAAFPGGPPGSLASGRVSRCSLQVVATTALPLPPHLPFVITLFLEQEISRPCHNSCISFFRLISF